LSPQSAQHIGAEKSAGAAVAQLQSPENSTETVNCKSPKGVKMPLRFIDPQKLNIQITPLGLAGQPAVDTVVIVSAMNGQRLEVAWHKLGVVVTCLLNNKFVGCGIGLCRYFEVHS
jgi:hypothetical protein